METRTSGSVSGQRKRIRLNHRHRAPARPYTYVPTARGFVYLVAIMD